MLGACPRIEADRFIAPAKPALPPSLAVVARESYFELDFLRRIAGSLTKTIGKSGQNQLLRTSAWMHVGRTMQEQLSSRLSILGQAPRQIGQFELMLINTLLSLQSLSK